MESFGGAFCGEETQCWSYHCIESRAWQCWLRRLNTRRSVAMQEGTTDSSWANVSEEGEVFKLPVLAEHVALGRLGRIYKALDRKTGRMLAVECIDVIDGESTAERGGVPVEIVQQALKTELERCTEIADEEMRHVFYYDSVSYSQSRVYLRSSFSVINNLAGLQKDFERLHPLAVKQYIYQALQGLCELHKSGISCGGLSLSSLLLCGGNSVKIAAWFPSLQTVKTLQYQEFLVDTEFCRSNFGLQFTQDAAAQDVRSVAYVMLEMLTGLRVHGSLMEKSKLLSKVATDSPEHQVLSSLLALSPLEDVLAHVYFAPVIPKHKTAFLNSQVVQEQRQIIGVLTKHELQQCQAMKRQYLQQIRAWQAQFEKKYRRKPKPADRSAGIVRLQRRCQALNERMQELNDRLAASHGSIYRMIADTQALTIDASSHSATAQEGHPSQHGSFEDVPAGSSVFPEGESDSVDRSEGRRSPAQKAFLNRFQ